MLPANAHSSSCCPAHRYAGTHTLAGGHTDISQLFSAGQLSFECEGDGAKASQFGGGWGTVGGGRGWCWVVARGWLAVTSMY